MARYHFITRWTFDAPVEAVWSKIKAIDEWPQWWPYVQKVELLQPGDADEVGAIRRITWRTALPYTLTFDSELVSSDRYKRMEGRAFGELEGAGIWTFASEKGKTTVRYDWMVNTTKPWMNFFSPIARPLFAWNHDKVMAAGYKGLQEAVGSRRSVVGSR